jgi:hypothetical protein
VVTWSVILKGVSINQLGRATNVAQQQQVVLTSTAVAFWLAAWTSTNQTLRFGMVLNKPVFVLHRKYPSQLPGRASGTRENRSVHLFVGDKVVFRAM